MPETTAAPEIVPPTEPPTPPTNPALPTPPARSGRRWLKVLLAVVLLLLLLVIFAPTLAGTAPVRLLVLSKVNDNLNGKITVEDWSVGWRSGLSVTGVRVLDANGAQVMQLSKLTTQLTLLNAIRGKYALGETVIDGLDALVKSDAAGEINLASLTKKMPAPEARPSEPAPAPAPVAESKAEKAKEPGRLPDISGNIRLINCKLTYEDGRAPEIGGSGQTFFFPSIAGQVKIPSINEPIENALDLTCHVGQRPQGTISTKGTISAVKNNAVDVENASINQTLTLRQIESEAMTFVLGKDSSIRKLAGLTDADVSVRAQPGQDAVLTAHITSKNFAVGGPALKGDTLTSKSLVVSVPSVIIGRSANPNDMKLWTVKAGTEAQPLTVEIDQGTVSAFVDASVGSLQNFAAGLAPGSVGSIRSDVNLDVGALGKELRTMFAMKQGVELKSAKLVEAMNITLAADRAKIDKFNVDLTDVVAKQADNTDFAPKPIHLALTAASFGGGWSSPDVRDLDLNLQSGFVTATAKAKQLSDDLRAQLTANLKQFQDEWGAIVDLGGLDLSGTVTATADSQGNVAGGEDAKLGATVALSKINVSHATPNAGPSKGGSGAVLADYSGDLKFAGRYSKKDPLQATLDVGSLTYSDGGKLLDVVASGILRLTTAQGTKSRETTLLEKIQTLKVSIKMPDLQGVQNVLNEFSTAPPDLATAASFRTPLEEQFAAVGAVTVPAAAPSKDVTPAMALDAGSATIDLSVTREGERSVVTAQAATQGLVIHKGQAKSALGTVGLQWAMSLISVAPPATTSATPAVETPGLMQQMRDLQVTKLDIGGAGGRIFITEPIKIADPAGISALLASLTDPKAATTGSKPLSELAANLHVTGNLGELMALLKVLQADATPGTPYQGNYSFDQKISAGPGGLTIVGLGNVDDLKNADGTFDEKRLHLANDLNVDGVKQTLSIRGLLIDTEATKALTLSLKGDVLNFATERRLQNFGGTLAADWAKAWELVRPMVSPETQKSLNLTVAGKQDKPFALSGSYPAGKPFNEAVQTLVGSFGLHIDLLDVEGLKIEKLDLPLALKGGHARIAFADKPQGQDVPAAADCNGGKLLLGGADIDLSGPVMRLTLPANHKLVENVGLNKILSDRLGDFINNPLFVDPDEAAGTLSVTVANCEGLALVSPKDPAARQGRATINIAVSTLQLGNAMLKQIADELNQEDIFKSLRGEITKESSIRIENGKTYQDITILTAQHKRPFRITGDTDLATSKLHLTFLLPGDLLGSKMEKLLPNGLPLPLAGTTRGVQFDLVGTVQSLVQKNLVPGLIDSLTGGGKTSGNANDPAAKSGVPNPQDILGIFGKPSKDPDKEKAKQQRYEERRKAREAAAATQPASSDDSANDDSPATKKKKKK